MVAGADVDGQSHNESSTIQEILKRDYSDQVWAGPNMGLGAFQILFLTSYIFSAMYDTDISAFKVFVAILTWFFWTQPTACYMLILLGLAFQGSEYSFAPHTLSSRKGWLWKMLTVSQPQFWWNSCLLMMIYSVASLLGNPAHTEALEYSNSNLAFSSMLVAPSLMLVYATSVLRMIKLGRLTATVI